MKTSWPAFSVAMLLIGGCTIVTVEGGAKTSTPYFGVLRIAPAPGSTVLVYRARGLGIVPGRSGVTIGAADETAALIFAAEDCRIILFQPREQNVAALRTALLAASSTADTMCILGEKKP